MPDATELELTAQELRASQDESIVDTEFYRGRATLVAKPAHIRMVLEHLRGKGYTRLMSLHGVDYYPEEPRLGILYEMLDMKRVDRISVKARVHTDDPRIDTVMDMFPSANFQEREAYDMFGVVFEGHADLRRILMPEDYEGFPQRRDFPVGGEPILFTYNEEQNYGKYM